MAQLAAFSYIPRITVVHSLDVRIKLVLLMLISLSVLGAGAFGLGVMSLCLLAVIYYLRLPLKSICFELRYIIILLALVFFARAVSTSGDSFITLKWLSVSKEGVHEGVLVVWRMMLIVLLGLVFTATTSPYSIKAAIQWILKPVPRIPHARIATMMALLLRLIPLMLTQASETMDAQRARGVENRKNPFYRIKNFSIPFLRRSFETADRMAIAMDARCYSDHRTDPDLKASMFDLGILSIAAGICIACYLI